MDLRTIWYLLFGVLLIGYAVLDGFDLGVGMLHLLARDDKERRLHMNAIGPVWDGNEVWLLTGGGALFAAFPIVYATVFSAFYLALMLVLLTLILRAVALEFRSKVEAPAWRRTWDWAFGLGSLLAAVLFGTALGNILRGIPLDAQGRFTGTFLGLLNPYSLLVGLVTVALFFLHGAAYLTLKTEGELQARIRRFAWLGYGAFVVLYGIATVLTAWQAPFLFNGLFDHPLFWAALAVLVLALVGIASGLRTGRDRLTFLATSVTVLAAVSLVGLSLFPNLVPSSINPDYSLSIYNASSTPYTLQVMLIIALIGMPLVLGYTAFIYSKFKGKVVLHEDSY